MDGNGSADQDHVPWTGPAGSEGNGSSRGKEGSNAPASRDEGVRLSKEEQRARTRRSIAIALALVGLVILFYIATIVRLGGNVLNRPM